VCSTIDQQEQICTSTVAGPLSHFAKQGLNPKTPIHI
jgi:hypothetical protein